MIWIAISLASGTAHADECDTERFDFPDYTYFNLDSGERLMAFDFAGVKKLAQKLECGKFHLRMRQVEKRQLVEERIQSDALKRAIDLYKKKVGILDFEVTRIHGMWETENKKRHVAENKTDYSWLGWTAAAILATTTVSFGVAFVLK